MDPASAIFPIVSFGDTVLAKVDKICKDIKGTPEEVRDLKRACADVAPLLRNLSATTARTVLCPPEAVPQFKRMCTTTQRCLQDVFTIIDKVIVRSKFVTSSGEPSARASKVRSRKGLKKKSVFEDASAKLEELRETLAMLIDVVNS